MGIKSPIFPSGSVGTGSDVDTASVMDYGAIGDGVTNDTAAIQAAINSGKKHILFPYTAGGYRINTGIQVHGKDNVLLEGEGGVRPVLKSYSSDGTHLVSLYQANNTVLKNLTLSMQNSTGTGCSLVINDVDGMLAEDCDIVYGRAHNVSALGGSTLLSFSRCGLNNSSNDAVNIDGCSKITFKDCQVNSNGNFGIYCKNITSDVNVEGCFGASNDLEFFVSNWDSDKIRVANCIVHNCGDNGISLGGTNLKVIGNTCYLNQNNGIAIYGKRFVCVGNKCYDNNKSAGAFSGIAISPAWGGIGSFGLVDGNSCFDTQGSATQKYGIELLSSQYTTWGAGQTILAAYPYRVNAGKLYRASAITVDTVAGATPPTHSSGTASDGNIVWTYLDASTTSFNAGYVAYSGNHCYGNVTGQHQDSSGSSTIFDHKLGWFGVGIKPATVGHIYRNTTGANTMFTLEEDGTGDCTQKWLLTATIAYAAGIDNSDNDLFKFSCADDGFASLVAWQVYSDARFKITGGEMKKTVAQPAGGTLANTNSGTTYTNEGASARTDFTLPTAVAELEFSFIVQDSDGIRVIAASGDTIRVAGSVSAAAGRIDNATIGSAVTIRAINATEWIATATVGTWTPT